MRKVEIDIVGETEYGHRLRRLPSIDTIDTVDAADGYDWDKSADAGGAVRAIRLVQPMDTIEIRQPTQAEGHMAKQ